MREIRRISGCILLLFVMSFCCCGAPVFEIDDDPVFPKMRDEHTTKIKIGEADMPSEGRLSAGIYKGDVLLKTIYEGEKVPEGIREMYWDLRDGNGKITPEGQYALKAVFNNLSCTWVRSIGNSGNPPWGKTKILAGLFNVVEIFEDRVLTANVTGEFGKIVQLIDKDNLVIWTSPIPPVHGRITAGTLDDKFAYLVIAQDTERDFKDRTLIRDVLWRLDIDTGRTVPWDDGKLVLPLTDTRYSGIYMNIGTRFLPASEPYPGWNIADIEARGGKIYVSCHRKGCIKVLDRTTGEVINTIPIPDPKGISIDKSGRLWVISRGNVARLNRDGGGGRGMLYYAIPVSGLTHAWDVELDEEGNIYVSVTGEEHQVHVYDKSGRLIRRIGKEKGGAIKDGSLERLYIPLGISVDSQDLMVADHGNGRIAVFDKKTGKYKRTIESFGYGGCNGAVKFVGNQDNVYTSNTYFFRHPVNNLNCYKTGISENKPWELVRRYANIAPAKSMEPMGIFNNGKKTYLCMMGRFPSWYEMDQEGVLHFCGALFYPRHVAPLRGTFKREVLSDLRRFGLVGEDDRLKYRIAWIDHNRDMRVQEDELEVTDDDASFYSYNDGMVDEQGNMYMHDYHTHRFYRFRMNGYDKAGNPVYSWKAAEELIDLKDYIESKGIDSKDDLEGWMAYGKRVDSDGNMYFILQKGAACWPDDVRIAGFAKDGRLLWEVGRKAKGLKDRPGEFVSSHGFLGIIDGIVFALEYEGQADLYTTDGLYLATLLQGFKKEGPYANYGGENFFGDAIKGDDGNIYFMINSHNYAVPIFRLENRETIKRFSSPVTVTKEWIEKAEEFKAAERGDEKQGGQWGLQYVLRVSDDEITVDGNDAEWADVPGEVAHTGDPDDEEIRATLKAAYSETYLYLMAKIKDQTPAVNACSSVSTLWDGDCLGFYVSGDWRKRSTAGNKNWKEWDSIVHVAPREKKGLRLGLLNRAGEAEWREITDVSLRGLETGEDYYGMEVAIPWEELKFRPAADKLIGWDWDVCYSAGSGERREFKIHWYPFGNVIGQRQDWDYGRFLEDLSGGDTVRCVSLTAEDEESLEAIPAYIIKVDGSETYAAYMRAYTHEENMCFLFEVNDPDPAINTAAMAMFSGTGDYIDVVIDGRTYNIPVGIRGEDQLYSVKGGAVAKIKGTSFELNVKGRGYQVKATIPLRQIGKKKQYRFNWMVAFSDRSGGAVFRKALWRKKEGALISE